MSELDDDIARGCLENGEPIEARWGSGWWSAYSEQEQSPTDIDIWNDLQRQLEELNIKNKLMEDALIEIASFDVSKYLRYENVIKFIKDIAQQALKES